MHPRWQQKVLKYYQDLFTSKGKQNVQMIIATHSSYVIQSALKSPNNNLIIVLQNNNGKIEAKSIKSPGVLPQITAAETNYLAFHIPTIDYHIELYGWLQRKNGDLNVKRCDDYIKNHHYYVKSRHHKSSSFIDKNNKTIHYETLPTYIRNAIDHPDPQRPFTEEQLKISIELLIKLCR